MQIVEGNLVLGTSRQEPLHHSVQVCFGQFEAVVLVLQQRFRRIVRIHDPVVRSTTELSKLNSSNS